MNVYFIRKKMGFTGSTAVSEWYEAQCPDAVHRINSVRERAGGAQTYESYEAFRAAVVPRGMAVLAHDAETDIFAQTASATSPTHLVGMYRMWLPFVASVSVGAPTYLGAYDTRGTPEVKEMEHELRAQQALVPALDAHLRPLRRLHGWISQEQFLSALDDALAAMARDPAADDKMRGRIEKARAAGGFAFFMSSALHDRPFRNTLRAAYACLVMAGETGGFEHVGLDGMRYAPLTVSGDAGFCMFGVPGALILPAGHPCREGDSEFRVGEAVATQWDGRRDERTVVRPSAENTHGEADAKIIDVVRELVMTTNGMAGDGDAILLRSRDSDVLARALMLADDCRDRLRERRMRIFLDKGGASGSAVVVDVTMLAQALRAKFPRMLAPVHAIVMCCLMSGSDFTVGPPGVGFTTLISAFEAIGPTLLERALELRDGQMVIEEDAFALLLAAARHGKFGMAQKRARGGAAVATNSPQVRFALDLLEQSHARGWLVQTISSKARAAPPLATSGRSVRMGEHWDHKTDALAVRQSYWALLYYAGRAPDCLQKSGDESVWGWQRNGGGKIEVCRQIVKTVGA